MDIAYIDCFCGISGDMTLGGLVDLGVDPEQLTGELRKVQLPEWELRVEKVVKRGISATQATVDVPHDDSHEGRGRTMAQIAELIEESDLAGDVKETSLAVFGRLAEAEARIHDTTPENVHFHEVGAVDAIVDVVGAVVGFGLLGVERIHGSAVPLSHGVVSFSHGTYPVPAPATLEIIKGLPTRTLDVEGETVTPTGAAIHATLATDFGPMPSMRVEGIGYGAGAADFRDVPNVVRIVRGQAAVGEGVHQDTVCIVEANIDDMNPELYDAAMDALFAAGAVDAWLTPIQMKKGRPGITLAALVHPKGLEDVTRALFEHTTTFGVRIGEMSRRCLEREHVEVETRYGRIRVKVARHRGRIATAAPEYQDCRTAAEANGVPLKQVYEEALRQMDVESEE
ncbi:MAG: nickel pincer cofactor biosynthesis protein LarC [Armatimonadota bacterium]